MVKLNDNNENRKFRKVEKFKRKKLNFVLLGFRIFIFKRGILIVSK